VAKDDFFLSFGTDADVFASKIEAESDRAAGGINRLIDALEDYEGTVNKAQAGGPLRNLFGALDQAATKFGSLTNQLVSGMDSALRGVGQLTEELAGLVDAVNKINELKPNAKKKTQSAVAGITDEEILATDSARRSSKAVGEIIELNATQARNALKRVADINATVGRNSNAAADGLKELARQIRELNGAAKEAKGRGTIANVAGGQQIIVVQGGGTVQAGESAPINVADILQQAAAASPKAAAAPISDQEADAQVRAEARRRRNDPEALQDLSQPARSGLYTYPGVEAYSGGRRGGRLVGADVREGESFQDYFARNDATRSRIEAARAELPKPDRADLADFNQFKLSGGKAKDFANDLEARFRRILAQDKTASAITAESIKASLTDLGLEQQYPALPGIIERVFKVRAEQRAHAEKVIRDLIKEDPAVTFGGGAFGVQNSDFEVGNTFPAALASIDEDLLNTHEGDPETVRLAQERRAAQQKRKDLRSAGRNFGDGSTVNPDKLVVDPGTADQEGLTLKQRQKADRDARAAARKKNKATVEAYLAQKAAEESGASTAEAEENYRTVYRGSHDPLNLDQITEEGLRVTQDRSYAEEHGGLNHLYRARIPASHFETSPFTDEEIPHTRLTREQIEQYGGFEQIVGPDGVANTAQSEKRPPRKPSQKGALRNARSLVQSLERDINALGAEDEAERASLQAELDKARALVDQLRQARAPGSGPAASAGGTNAGGTGRGRRRTGGGGSGGGGTPPPPPNTGAAGEPEPDDAAGKPRAGAFGADTSKAKNRSTSQQFKTDYAEQLALLQPTTRAILEDAKARLLDTRAIADQTERIRQQDAILVQAGAAFKNDAAFKNYPNLTTARGTFAQGVGLPPSKENYQTLQHLFTRGGAIDASGLVNSVKKVTDAAGGGGGGGDEGGLLGKKLFGNKGFLDAQLRHIGLAIENFAGFQLVFTGFEKLKELVETGIQADAAFVRLQASINAAGRSVGNLRQQLQGVSSATATSLHDTIEAASELTGVFKNNNDLVGGTQVATELSNISQGALTAKESAVGLRDVIDAYGLTGVKSVRQVGDEIARLSQTTGVSVKDILEGTTQLAQEAKQFGLGQRQASVLSAFVTRSTGETGEAAAEQVSRILSTLDNGKVQGALEAIRVPKTGKPLATPEQFAQGKIGDVLGNVLQNYDQLDPGQQSQIRALIGTGRQARALAGLLRDAKAASDEFNNSSKDAGSLAQQNQRFLNSLAGVLKTLSTDFKNLGATLQQSGVFNIIGVFAKGLDDVLKIVTKVLNVFNQIADSNPFTKAIKDVGVLVAEVALLFKIASGSLGTLAGFINPGRRQVPQLARNGSAILDAEGAAVMGYAPLTAREVARAPINLGRGIAGRVRGIGAGIGNFFAPQFEAGGLSPGGGFLSSERAAALNSSLTARQRFSAQAGIRGERALAGEGGRLTRSLFNAGAPGLANITNNLGTATSSATSSIGRMTSGLTRLSAGFLGPLAGMVAFSFALDKIIGAINESRQIGKDADKIAATLRGENDQKNAAKNQGKDPDGGFDPNTEGGQAANDARKVQDRANSYKGVTGFLRGVYGGLTQRSLDPNHVQNGYLGFLSVGGGYDTGFDSTLNSTTKLVNKRISSANSKPAGERVKDLEDAKTKAEKDFQEEQKYIDGLDLNSEQKANAEAQLATAKAAFEAEYAKLIANAHGIADLNRLNIQQVENLEAALQESANLNPETLTGALGERIKQSILDNSGLPKESQGYKDLEKSLSVDPNGATSTASRLKGAVGADEEALKNAQEAVDAAPHDGGDEAKRATAARDAAASKLQSDRKSLRDLAANNAQALATQAIGTGDTKGALTQTTSAIAALEEANKHLSKDDPEYIANITKINELKKQFADQTYESAILADQLAAASTNDPLIRAQAEYQKAVDTQKSVLSRPHTKAEEEQAAAGVATAGISKAQAAEDLRVAQYQQGIAGRVDNQTLIQDQINEILKEEQKYASGTLANAQKLAELKGQEADLRQKLAQTAGEEADAATETQIAELQARGQAGDAEKAAQLQVSEIQNKMARYLKRPGAKKTDSAYQQLAAQLATARRNSFDVALQAQLDTLDFQRETYKITSSQEVQALQEILKNKQLTLKEQRDITLKIKNLQESIRQQLTGGGFNIPSDIKLPTAYQVRRSLGGGFGNGQTTVNNVSNATNQVTVNNNVPTAAVAQQIANQVINLINSQTGQSARANTSTPRLVGT